MIWTRWTCRAGRRCTSRRTWDTPRSCCCSNMRTSRRFRLRRRRRRRRHRRRSRRRRRRRRRRERRRGEGVERRRRRPSSSARGWQDCRWQIHPRVGTTGGMHRRLPRPRRRRRRRSPPRGPGRGRRPGRRRRRRRYDRPSPAVGRPWTCRGGRLWGTRRRARSRRRAGTGWLWR
jgi:hypothetical protein